MRRSIKPLFIALGVVVLLSVFGIWWVYARTATPPDIAAYISQYVVFNPPDSVYRIRALESRDHVLGSLDAPLVAIEYTDLECPYCKQSHFRLKEILNDPRYKDQVAVVIRHFPLDHRHAKARAEGEAAECAALLGGNNAFFAFVDAVFTRTRSNDALDLRVLPDIAHDVGLAADAFAACQQSSEVRRLVEDDVSDALTGGLSVTPSMVIFRSDGKRSLVIGSQSTATYKRIFDTLLGRDAEGPLPTQKPAFTE